MTNAIFKRTSVRKYLDKKVSPDQIEMLLKAAMAAPSARNFQPWEFVVIEERQTLDTISEYGPFANMLKQAPLAIVVCADISKDARVPSLNYWLQDCSAATQNIMLESTELGLGSVWIGTYPKEVISQPLKKLLKLPQHIIPVSTIAIGYEDGKVQPKDKFDKSKIHYEKW